MTDEKQPLTGPEIIERVRREVQHINLSREHNTDIAYRAILTVLDAIREPSEAMLDDALACADDDDATTAMRSIWRAMIDALRREIAG